jgi:hypothetical protein
MNNEEKILSMLEVVVRRLDGIEEDMAEIKEYSTETRDATDQLLECWADFLEEQVLV